MWLEAGMVQQHLVHYILTFWFSYLYPIQYLGEADTLVRLSIGALWTRDLSSAIVDGTRLVVMDRAYFVVVAQQNPWHPRLFSWLQALPSHLPSKARVGHFRDTSIMSSALANASRLKADIRLAQAISQFEADLSLEQKTRFKAFKSEACHRPPNAKDVMRLTAEIDRQTFERAERARCFGPRLTNTLQAVQQFAALGDVVIGGSQNVIACGVWSVVRLSLLVGILSDHSSTSILIRLRSLWCHFLRIRKSCRLFSWL